MTTTPVGSTPSAAVRHAEIAIVGGGPAGLSAALVLGRARRNVVVIDGGDAAHFAADAVHGFLGQENVPPRELRRRVWEQLAPFDVTLVEAQVVAGAQGAPDGESPVEGRLGARPTSTAFTLTLADGSLVVAQAVLLAGGVRFGVRDIPGLAELWGSRLFHCPFCHGWEVVGKRVGVIAPVAFQAHLRPLLALWADDLQVFGTGEEPAEVDAPAGADGVDVTGPGEPAGDEGAHGAHGAPAGDPAPVVQRVRLDGDEVVVEFQGGGEARVDALFSPPVIAPADDLALQLGAERSVASPLAEVPLGVATGESGATNVPGLYAAGDITGQQQSVSPASSGGFDAGVGIVRFLIGMG